MKLSDHALDTERLEGIWWDYETGAQCDCNQPHETHGCFLVVPVIGSRFDAVVHEEQRPYLEAMRKKPTDLEAAAHRDAVEQIMVRVRARALAKTILLDWRNIEKADGSPWPYSEDDAAVLFTERRWLQVAKQIELWSMSTDAAKMREEEQARGN